MVLFLSFAYTSSFRLVLYSLVVLIGTLVGLEIPLLMRILKDRYAFQDVVSNVLTFDYLGALVASIAFPILLVPHLGLVRTALLFGLINAAIALWSTHLFAAVLRSRRALQISSVVVLVLLVTGMAVANRVTSNAEGNIYSDDVIFSRELK